ncbi:lactonase family protein [Pedobacter sp. UYP30]|uniref:lactonase family protein n=1 Tax=Pedobacter sp. UYP30 TaxID=1756400 RepID=UPI0033950099
MKPFLCTLILLSLFKMSFAQKLTENLLIGTYTNTGMAKGIYSYGFNTANAKATQVQELDALNPSFLALAPDGRFVYAVNESGKTSTVSAFKYNKKTQKLEFINKVASAGTDPCYITVNAKHVFVANYSSGSLAVFNRMADGSITDEIQVIQHTGSGSDPKGRQKSAHVHMGIFSPDKKYFIVDDLGEDKVYTYKYHPEAKKEILTPYAVYKTTPGTGPRHIVFGKDGKFAYLVHEFNGRIAVLAFADGKFKEVEHVETVAEGFSGAIDGAEILLSADGKFLYESNRGDANTISVFSVAENGTLKLVETVPSLGKGPRSFVIDPTGKYLLVAHQYTKEIVVFKRSKATGKLSNTGKRIELGAAVCLVFAN